VITTQARIKETETLLSDSKVLLLPGGFEPATPKSLAWPRATRRSGQLPIRGYQSHLCQPCQSSTATFTTTHCALACALRCVQATHLPNLCLYSCTKTISLYFCSCCRMVPNLCSCCGYPHFYQTGVCVCICVGTCVYMHACIRNLP
jgi:hypothetical protein